MRFIFPPFALLLLSALALSACDTRKSSRDRVPMTAPVAVPKPAITQEPPSWSPEFVKIKCAETDCPREVGLLLFAKKETDGQKLWRCTAFLISENTIMSAGHCAPTAPSTGYFLTPNESGTPKFRKVKSVLFKEFTETPEGEEAASGRPDVAVFELEQPLEGIPPARLARSSAGPMTGVIAYVINQGPSSAEFVVERRACLIHRHEIAFPFDVTENPDMWTAFDCETVPGNSGAPLYDSARQEVQAVLAGATRVSDWREKIRAEQKRELLPFESKKQISASNVRCLGWPSPSPVKCLEASPTRIRERSNQILADFYEGLNSRQPRQGSADYQYTIFNFAALMTDTLRTNPVNELIYFPACRQGPWPTEKIPSVIETLQLTRDEWARLKWEVLEEQVREATVTRTEANLVELRVDWPPPRAPLENPELDIRKRSQPLVINIPPCSPP